MKFHHVRVAGVPTTHGVTVTVQEDTQVLLHLVTVLCHKEWKFGLGDQLHQQDNQELGRLPGVVQLEETLCLTHRVGWGQVGVASSILFCATYVLNRRKFQSLKLIGREMFMTGRDAHLIKQAKID